MPAVFLATGFFRFVAMVFVAMVFVAVVFVAVVFVAVDFVAVDFVAVVFVVVVFAGVFLWTWFDFCFVALVLAVIFLLVGLGFSSQLEGVFSSQLEGVC